MPLAPAFGKVDFCRIGCDIGLDWDDKPWMRFLHRERVSTKNAVTNSIYRRQLDKRAFLNDPDVFLLRDENIFMSEEQKKALSFINGLFGSLIFTSDNVATYSEEKFSQFCSVLEHNNAIILSVENFKEEIIVKYVLEDKEYSAIINTKKGRIKIL